MDELLSGYRYMQWFDIRLCLSISMVPFWNLYLDDAGFTRVYTTITSRINRQSKEGVGASYPDSLSLILYYHRRKLHF